MARWFSLAAVFALALGLAVDAQDSKDPKAADSKAAPKSKTVTAPEGWKFVKPKDKYFAFLVPKDVESESLNDGSFKSGELSGKTTGYHASLKDGRQFIVVQTVLSGPAIKDMTIKDVYELLYENDKGEKGTRISEPKEITVGVRKGQEYFVTEKGTVRRVVSVVMRDRAFQLIAIATKREKVTDKDCDTFLTSLMLQAIPKPATPDKKEPEKKDAPPKQAP
jgi:hypothetical protein